MGMEIKYGILLILREGDLFSLDFFVSQSDAAPSIHGEFLPVIHFPASELNHGRKWNKIPSKFSGGFSIAKNALRRN